MEKLVPYGGPLSWLGNDTNPLAVFARDRWNYPNRKNLRNERYSMTEENGVLRLVYKIPGVNVTKLTLKTSQRQSQLEVTGTNEEDGSPFSGQIQLGRVVDASTMNATYRHGVLRVTVGKPDVAEVEADIPLNP